MRLLIISVLAFGAFLLAAVSSASAGGPTPTSTPDCDPAYPDVCIPSPPPDLNCGDITDTDFTVLDPDPHGFDGDTDGIGCESGGEAVATATLTPAPPQPTATTAAGALPPTGTGGTNDSQPVTWIVIAAGLVGALTVASGLALRGFRR